MNSKVGDSHLPESLYGPDDSVTTDTKSQSHKDKHRNCRIPGKLSEISGKLPEVSGKLPEASGSLRNCNSEHREGFVTKCRRGGGVQRVTGWTTI